MKRLARFFFRLRRVYGAYLAPVNALGVWLLVFDRWGWMWFVYLAPVLVLVVWALHRFDTKYGLPQENGLNLRDNPEWQKFLEEWREKANR